MNEYLFSYGTLQKADVQLRLFGRRLTGTRDSLKGYTLSSIEITDESFLAKGEQTNQLTAVISDEEKDAIEGTAFEISEKDLLMANEYEPDNYQRIQVVLASGKQAWLYLATKT